MFTGLVQDVGTLTQIRPGPTTDLWISTSLPTAEFSLGESIAVNGACLTVVEIAGATFRVQAAPETLRKTTLGALKVGARVHLERALRLSDRLGGHLVLGHVDAVAQVLLTRADGEAWHMELALPPALLGLFIEKGSVTLDGVSLTLNQIGTDRFSVLLIPETLARTTLGERKVGEGVNVEADVLGKYVARLMLVRAEGGLSEASILAKGFGGGER